MSIAAEPFPSPSGQAPGRFLSDGSPANRVVSVDVFRGLTMLVMIFVNDLASVKGLPWWTYHMPGRVNGMTYVDMVFPAFLFLVGMSLPLAVTQRLKRGDSVPRLYLHVALRSFSLIVLGVILANAEKGNGRLMRFDPNLWALVALLGAILFWNAYPRSLRDRRVDTALKLCGLLMMLAMFAIFRRATPGGQAAWLDFSYWEILGIIGWTYLAVSIVYIPTRNWRWAPFFWLVLFGVLNISSSARWLSFPRHLPSYMWPFDNGAHCLITAAGMGCSAIFLSGSLAKTWRQKVTWGVSFGVVQIVAAALLTPLGISKIRATPSWCLYSAGSSVLIFLLLYWVCDRKGHTTWAAFVRPAGSNTLTTYLLPDLYYFATAALGVSLGFEQGWPGVVRAALFTAAMLAAAALVTRWKIRMRL